MATLPVISGRDAVKAFEKLGFAFHRQKGSHISSIIQTVVIVGARSSRAGQRNAPRANPRAGVTVEEFVALI
jgi:predicted RNA binding protein YcfA (HicA-like mRNA interferase family)